VLKLRSQWSQWSQFVATGPEVLGSIPGDTRLHENYWFSPLSIVRINEGLLG
jgi:hypothetical protein